ncbi:WxL domain-containing protein [Levilactobacillus brevis]|nr:WxL domain-containing protein [Levilactobacillus brevis]
MKIKSGLLTSAIVLGMVAPLTLPVVANAADGSTDATSSSAVTSAEKSASVEVTGGNLTFTKNADDVEAPSFQFTGAKASTAAQNGLKSATFANENDKTDNYAGSELAVDDNTGSGAGWHVTAKLGNFSDTASHSLSGAILHMNPTSTASDDKDAAATASTTDLTAGASAASVVFSAAAGKGLGHSSTDFAGATLDLPSPEYAGHYVADLTYTLTSGPADNPTA